MRMPSAHPRRRVPRGRELPDAIEARTRINKGPKRLFHLLLSGLRVPLRGDARVKLREAFFPHRGVETQERLAHQLLQRLLARHRFDTCIR